MKYILLFHLILSGITPSFQDNKSDIIFTSDKYTMSSMQTENHGLCINEKIGKLSIPDTIKVKAKVLKIRNKRNGYIVDVIDTNNLNYYKIVSWKCSSDFGEKIIEKEEYEFMIWPGAPSQIGDFTFKQRYISNNGKLIKLNYKIKRRIVVPTFYYTKNLNGLYYLETKK